MSAGSAWSGEIRSKAGSAGISGQFDEVLGAWPGDDARSPTSERRDLPSNSSLNDDSPDEDDPFLGGYPPRVLEPGPQLGRYQILEMLGEGRHARVYRGFDPVLQRTVALKVMPSAEQSHRRQTERLLREARVLAQLSHPGIVPVFELGRAGDLFFIAMPLIEGQTLAELRDQGIIQLGVHRVLETVADLADALGYAHDQGIVHRDVKPQNIQIDQTGHVFLMDFGIACRRDAGQACGASGEWSGTPPYVAPELARGDPSEVSPASDQYSLGVVFYELLCGRPPFVGPPLYVLFQAANLEPPSPRSVKPFIPAELAGICLRTLARSPSRRFPSCHDLASTLRRYLQETPGEPQREDRLAYLPARIVRASLERAAI